MHGVAILVLIPLNETQILYIPDTLSYDITLSFMYLVK